MLARIYAWAYGVLHLDQYGHFDPPIARQWQRKWNVERRVRQLRAFVVDPMDL